MSKSDESFLRRNFGPLITAIVPLVAVIVSAGQIWVAHVAKEKEMAINQQRFDHQIKQDLVKFVTENEKELFSENESERARISNIISVAFPPDITAELFKKLKATVTDEASKKTWTKAEQSVERIKRNDVTIQYYSNNRQIYEKKKSLLDSLGFNVVQKPRSLDTPVNSLWFGEQVDTGDVKLIARMLLDSGVELKAIRPFSNPTGSKANLVQIGSDAAKMNEPTLTLEQINEADEFTR